MEMLDDFLFCLFFLSFLFLNEIMLLETGYNTRNSEKNSQS
jgi:hypothetical protein